MKLREDKISNIPLLIVTIITLVFITLELHSKARVQASYFDEKVHAAELTLRAYAVIKDAVNRLNIPIDQINDPNRTGLIGMQYSPITTERGDLNAKLTSTNPNFAALIVQLLKESGVEKNDTIAVSFTGSFPALNIAVLSALKTLKVQPMIITSVSASMWGANYPQLTYLDMERELRDTEIFDYQSIYASIGGEDDIGRGMSPEGREIIESAIKRNNVLMLEATNLTESIQKRWDIYTASGKPRVFINVGGGSAALAGMDIVSGYIRPLEIKSGQSLIAQFSKSNVPVINLADINHLAEEYRLPNTPIPLPEIGEGNLYYQMRYSVSQAIVYTIILAILLFIVLRFDIDYYLKKIFVTSQKPSSKGGIDD
jgi:poly-gamma-glutamate system protein